jgi:hypothetical protein
MTDGFTYPTGSRWRSNGRVSRAQPLALDFCLDSDADPLPYRSTDRVA